MTPNIHSPRYVYCLSLVNLVTLVLAQVSSTSSSTRLVANLLFVASTLTMLTLAASDQRHTGQRLTNLVDSQSRTICTRERQRLAVALHDTVTQLVFATSLLVDSIPTDGIPKETASKLSKVQSMTSTTHTAVRHLLLGLRPSSIDSIPLDQLIAELIKCKQFGTHIPIYNQCTSSATFPPDIHHGLYQIVSLALDNAIFHACASSVEVYMLLEPDKVIISVDDDGIGFDPDIAASKPGHYGIADMRMHARTIA